jgi:hypothetical protein
MKKNSKRRGSALVLALVVAILAAGIGGAFLALSAWNSKKQFNFNQGDDCQQICDAGLEMARAALLQWKNGDIDVVPPGGALSPDCYAWNKVFRYCATNDAGGMGVTADADAIRADAMARFKKGNAANTWAYAADNTYTYDNKTTNTTTTIGSIGSSTSTAIGQGVADLFCINRRYGKGCFHLSLKNNTGDRHGDGVDNQVPSSGNPWRFDPPQSSSVTDPATGVTTTTPIYAGDVDTTGGADWTLPVNWGTGSGRFDPMIDGDGMAILTVTATLPDGTQRQIEVLLGFPFKAGGPMNAIQDNGDIDMSGAFQVQGTLGNVFANGNITGTGSNQANVSGNVSAAGSTSGLKMNNAPAGGVKSGVDPINIDPIDVTEYLNSPKYSDLRNNMYVLNADGTVDLHKGGSFYQGTSIPSGLSWSKAQGWGISGKTAPPEAVYYINGDFKMTGQGNAPAYQMTIIATGSVELGGNSQFTAAHTFDSSGTVTTTSTGQLVVAGADIKLSGTGVSGDDQYKGSFWANEQVDIQGTFSLNGSITGANATDTPGSAVSSKSKLSDPDLVIGGTPTITYNGGGSIVRQSADHLDLKMLNKLK